MQSFTTVVELPIYLSLAVFINFIIEWISGKAPFPAKLKMAFVALFFLCLAYFRLDFNSLKANNGFWGKDVDCCNQLIKNKKIFQNLTLPENAVLCNVSSRHYVEAMFYTNLPAYGFIPYESQYNELINKGKRIALFMPLDKKIPAYLVNDKNLIMLNDTVAGCE